MHIHIYALRDPRTRQYRYVGQTRKSLEERLRSHVRDAQSRPFWEAAGWVKGLHDVGLRPEIVPLESWPALDYDGVEKRKREWAALLAQQGHPILNEFDPSAYAPKQGAPAFALAA